MSFKRLHFAKRKNKTPSLKKMESREKFYKRNFLVFEIGFIIIAVPVLIVAIFSIPVLIYFTIVQNFHLWPFILVGVAVAFFQLLAIKTFVRKFYLDPYQLTFGEYLRMRYDERYQKEGKNDPDKQVTWYDDLDEFIVQLKIKQREQTYKMYALNHDNVDFTKLKENLS